MGSLNFRAPQNGKRGLSTSQRFLGGGGPLRREAEPCAGDAAPGPAHGRGEGGLNPTALHLKRPLFGKEGQEPGGEGGLHQWL